MKDNRVLAAGIIGFCLVVFGFILKSGVTDYINKERRVTVKGLCEREVDANLVTWSFSTYVTGDSLPALYNEINSTNAQVVSFLKANGLSQDEISILPPEVEDRVSNRWSNERVPFNYKLTTPISVTSADVAKVQDIVMKQGELLSRGIALGGYNSLSYQYTGFQDIKQELIEEAIANAKKTAGQFVSNYGSRLGKVITADQGQFSIEDLDETTDYIKKVRVVTSVTYYLR